MPNWVAKLSAVAVQSGVNADVTLTFTITNTSTNEVQTRTQVWNGSFTATDMKGYLEKEISRLNARDTAFPVLQAAVNSTLATG